MCTGLLVSRLNLNTGSFSLSLSSFNSVWLVSFSDGNFCKATSVVYITRNLASVVAAVNKMASRSHVDVNERRLRPIYGEKISHGCLSLASIKRRESCKCLHWLMWTKESLFGGNSHDLD